MPRYASKSTARVDVLVLGDHPAAYLTAIILKQKSKLRVVHAIPAGSRHPDRLVTVNPASFELHPSLAGLAKKLEFFALHGVQFLSDKAETRSDHRTKTAVIYTARYSDIRNHLANLAEVEGVETLGEQPVGVHRVHEDGVDLTLGKFSLKPTVLVVSDELPADQKSLLGIPDNWGPDVVHRFTSVKCKAANHLPANGKALMPMSLDLCGLLCWGWLIPGNGEFQLTVEQPIEKTSEGSGRELLKHWVSVLKLHGEISSKFEIPSAGVHTCDLPLGGALALEGVANRTLLIGPAGGFYSACGEDIYPGCWSAIFAAEVLKKALTEKFLQDALNPYRQKWRTTLGDYLRGPQQNLRFLLPLVYRNPAMTARLAEAILLSKSVVR